MCDSSLSLCILGYKALLGYIYLIGPFPIHEVLNKPHLPKGGQRASDGKWSIHSDSEHGVITKSCVLDETERNYGLICQAQYMSFRGHSLWA